MTLWTRQLTPCTYLPQDRDPRGLHGEWKGEGILRSGHGGTQLSFIQDGKTRVRNIYKVGETEARIS